MNEKWLKEDGRKEWVRKMNQGYHEIKEHGKREFPFNIYPCSIPVDFTHVALHWHEEMEIIAVQTVMESGHIKIGFGQCVQK